MRGFPTRCVRPPWIGFHNNIKELTNVLGKNQFPSSLVNKTVKHYLSNFFASTSRTFAATSSNVSRTHYYKLPFVGPFSTYAQRRIKHLTRRYCKNLDIKLVFVPYKIKNLFSTKDAISKLSRSLVVYKFSCAGCVPVMSARQTDTLLLVFVDI